MFLDASSFLDAETVHPIQQFVKEGMNRTAIEVEYWIRNQLKE